MVNSPMTPPFTVLPLSLISYSDSLRALVPLLVLIIQDFLQLRAHSMTVVLFFCYLV